MKVGSWKLKMEDRSRIGVRLLNHDKEHIKHQMI